MGTDSHHDTMRIFFFIFNFFTHEWSAGLCTKCTGDDVLQLFVWTSFSYSCGVLLPSLVALQDNMANMVAERWIGSELVESGEGTETEPGRDKGEKRNDISWWLQASRSLLEKTSGMHVGWRRRFFVVRERIKSVGFFFASGFVGKTQ